MTAELTPCDPARPCRQAAQCARTVPRLCGPDLHAIDASWLRHCGGSWCPLFVDIRVEKLLEAA